MALPNIGDPGVKCKGEYRARIYRAREKNGEVGNAGVNTND